MYETQVFNYDTKPAFIGFSNHTMPQETGFKCQVGPGNYDTKIDRAGPKYSIGQSSREHKTARVHTGSFLFGLILEINYGTATTIGVIPKYLVKQNNEDQNDPQI
jgi:hypothetical protein